MVVCFRFQFLEICGSVEVLRVESRSRTQKLLMVQLSTPL